ncbi:MAG: ATP synthase F0 sector subunit c, partial [uncultured Rubrobacteraceae bacterium]
GHDDARAGAGDRIAGDRLRRRRRDRGYRVGDRDGLPLRADHRLYPPPAGGLRAFEDVALCRDRSRRGAGALRPRLRAAHRARDPSRI